jgi:hypothetical protein
MNHLPLICRTAMLFAVFFVSSILGFAQQTAQFGPSYDVVLQVVVGSNDAARSDLPKELSAISRQLRSKFAFSDYRLANTFLGRVGENGNLEYKSVANFLGKGESDATPTFLDWSLGNFSGVSEAGSKNIFHVQSFRFGSRVPVRMSLKADAPINYEPIGLSFNRVGFSANTPTLLGTLSLPQTDGMMFLIITVKPAEL